MVILIGALLVLASMLWWLLSLFLPAWAATAAVLVVMVGATVLITAVYRRAERFGRTAERDHSRRIRNVMKAARQAGRHDEIWEVTRRETAEADFALFTAADAEDRLDDFIAEWERALESGQEEAFFRQRRKGA